MTDTQREAFEDGRWYWVRYEGLGQTYEAPALYRDDAQAFYSYEFSGVPAREVIVLSALTQPQAQHAAAVPAGWKLVPIEPTPEMLTAAAQASMQHLIDCINDPKKAKEVGSEEMCKRTHASRYRTMLSSAPAAPQAQGPTEKQVIAAARVACKLHAKACGVDERDAWALYSDDFKNDAQAILQAAAGITGGEGG